ncbi:MAG: hypothetical protein CL483_07295 [Acidobacteria bacterium]|nr:hypothetical protein [Acidobacteriota bacterium]
MEEIDLLIVGGGVVGLACASAAARPGRTVCLLERHPRFGIETSTHNSGVIHAGIYYPPGSLKAALSVEGKEALYRFCARYEVPHRRCGKLIVAGPDDDIASLETLQARARANGVEDLALLDEAGLKRLEPHVRGSAALWSPSTGIVEAEALVRALRDAAERVDAALLPASELLEAKPGSERIEVRTTAERIAARAVVNAAGLDADVVSEMLGGQRFRIYPCRGEYAELIGPSQQLVSRPVYPMPAPTGEHLGIHVTPTTWGGVTIGPTIHYQDDKQDHERDRLPVEAFVESTRQLLPEVRPGDLRIGSTGIRAKLSEDPGAFSDFLIGLDPHQPRLIQAAGIDSPGLTACLAIARRVGMLADEVLDDVAAGPDRHSPQEERHHVFFPTDGKE